MTPKSRRLLSNICSLALLGCTSGHTATPASYAWNSSPGAWSQPDVPPPPRRMPPAPVPPMLSRPPPSAAATPSPVPIGWVNYGGLVLPSIPGLTVPLSNSASGPSASALVAPPNPPNSNSTVPNGWVNWNGICTRNTGSNHADVQSQPGFGKCSSPGSKRADQSQWVVRQSQGAKSGICAGLRDSPIWRNSLGIVFGA